MPEFSFFTSFSDPNRRDLVARFHQDLEASIVDRVGTAAAGRGFLDEQIREGARWRTEILRGVCETPVMVALLSANYFVREWCQYEWQIMCHREAVYAAHNNLDISDVACVIPVVWNMPETVWPDWSLERQYLRNREFGPIYLQRGLSSLMRRGRSSAAYQDLVHHVAGRIIQAGQRGLTPLGVDAAEAVIAGCAPAPGPRVVDDPTRLPATKVGFVVAAVSVDELPVQRSRQMLYRRSAVDWRPFYPGRPESAWSLASSALRLDAAGDLTPYPLSPELADMLRGFLDEARADGRVVVFLLDPWSTCVERCRRALAEFDGLDHRTAGVVAVVADDETVAYADALDQRLTEVMPRKRLLGRAQAFVWHTREADEFQESVCHVVDRLQTTMLQDSERAHRDSPFIRRETEGHPWLRGPGERWSGADDDPEGEVTP
ncbi:FxsC protein [Yinghuangia seranimata]|uniref:FxsC protein n=1 Tax=Yinghuangia seranimata TaxID=408067 RepID=UPI00248ADC59|nr:FxsC protein [Yinghuangia seranimata]MDI2125322.1 FxsC protein [Yinghuangia seranimata]